MKRPSLHGGFISPKKGGKAITTPTMLRVHVSLALAVALATNCNAAPALAYRGAATSCDFPSVKPHTRGIYRHHLELVLVGGRVSAPQECAEVCCVHPKCRAYAFQVVDRSSGKPAPNICITYSSTEVPAWESSVGIGAKYDFYTRPAGPKGATTPALRVDAKTAAAAVTPTAAASAPEPEPTETDSKRTDAPAPPTNVQNIADPTTAAPDTPSPGAIATTATDAPATDAPAMAMEDADHEMLMFGEDQAAEYRHPHPKAPKAPKGWCC